MDTAFIVSAVNLLLSRINKLDNRSKATGKQHLNYTDVTLVPEDTQNVTKQE